MRRKMWKCGQFSLCFIFLFCDRVELISFSSNNNNEKIVGVTYSRLHVDLVAFQVIPARWKIRRWFSICMCMCVYMSLWLMIFTLYSRCAVNTSFYELWFVFLSLAARRDNCTRSIIWLWLNRVLKQMILSFKWLVHLHLRNRSRRMENKWNKQLKCAWPSVRWMCVRMDVLCRWKHCSAWWNGGDNDDGDDDRFDIVYIESNNNKNNKNHTKNSDKIQMSLLLLYWNTSNKLREIKLSIYLFI